jgi:glycosyltransferase involved in cell wall biosynthesis
MKVIQISPAYKPAYIYGGPTLSVALLCEALVKLDTDLQVFTTTANGPIDFESDEEVKIVDDVSVTYFKRLFRGKVHFSLSLIIKLVFATAKTDIFHIHSWWNATAILSAFLGVLRGNKVILSPRGMLTNYSISNSRPWSKKLIHIVVGKWVLNHCYLHVTTEKEKTDVLQFIDHTRVSIIPNFAGILKNTPSNLQASESKNNVMKLLFLSRIDRKKGLEITLKALPEATFPWHLTIAGSGELGYVEYLQSEITRLKLKNKISWIGFVSIDDKAKVLMDHDLLVLFSYNENFANVVIESLSVGLPVAITDAVGLSDFVSKYNLGWVTTRDQASIIAALEEAYLDKTKRKSINLLAPGIIRKHFSGKTLVKQYLNMYLNNEC